MIKLIFQCAWYLLPAALGNHNASCGQSLWLPEIAKKYLAKLAVPIDSGAKWRGAEILGKNKTWRGLVVGVVTGIIVSGIQAILFLNIDFFRNNTLIDYGRVNFFLFGFLMGGGALFGDLVKSFIKRRLARSPGKPWFPWDQLDWIAGAMIASSPFYAPSPMVAAVTAVLYVSVHLCSDRIVYHMGIKKRDEIN